MKMDLGSLYTVTEGVATMIAPVSVEVFKEQATTVIGRIREEGDVGKLIVNLSALPVLDRSDAIGFVKNIVEDNLPVSYIGQPSGAQIQDAIEGAKARRESEKYANLNSNTGPYFTGH